FWPSANVFNYCKYVRFLDSPAASPSAPPFASDPAAWFAALQSAGSQGLRLHYVARNTGLGNDRELSAFAGGGGRWLMEGGWAADSAFWEARWTVGAKDARGAIWEVDYACIQQHGAHAPRATRPLATLHASLSETLAALSAFARRNNLSNFA